MKIKLNDNVIVITGKDRGQKGKVIKAMPKDNKVIVEGVNLKSSWKKDPNGQSIAHKEAKPIDVSNVAIADPKTGKASRIGIKKEAGKRVRVAKKSGAVIA